MTDTLDLTLLSASVAELSREMRLLRLQVEQLATNVMPERVAMLEQSFHKLVGEVARGFSEQQQHLTRIEHRVGRVEGMVSSIWALNERIDGNVAELHALNRRAAT